MRRNYRLLCRPGGLGGSAGAADGKTRGLESLREPLEQIGNDSGDGAVILGGQMAGLAVELGADGYGDVLDFVHGFPFHFQCAPGGGNCWQGNRDCGVSGRSMVESMEWNTIRGWVRGFPPISR